MNSDLAELLTPKQRKKVVKELTEELRQPLSVYTWVYPSVVVTGNRWLETVKKRKPSNVVKLADHREAV